MIINIFHKHVKETPDKIALIVDQSQLTYRELAQQIAAFSTTLETMGIKKGSHVAVILKKEGFINLDISALCEPDVSHD